VSDAFALHDLAHVFRDDYFVPLREQGEAPSQPLLRQIPMFKMVRIQVASLHSIGTKASSSHPQMR